MGGHSIEEKMKNYQSVEGGAEELLEDLKLTSGKMLVGQTSGYAAGVTPSGDVLVSAAGVFTIQALSVETGMIALLAVDTGQLAADAVDGTKIEDDAVDSEHIATGAVDPDHLVAALADKIPYLTAVAADVGNGTATLTVQAMDADGNELAANVLFRVWISLSSMGAAHVADASLTASTGTVIFSHAANSDLDVVTDATGEAVLVLDNDDEEVFFMVEILGVVYSV